MFLIAIFLALVGMGVHIIGLMGVIDYRLQIISVLYLALTISVTVLFFLRRLSLTRAFLIYGILAQVIESIRMILLVEWFPHDGSEAMLSNLVICYTLMLYVTMGYIRLAPEIITILFEATITFISFSPEGREILPPYRWFLFSIIEVSTCVCAILNRRAVHAIQQELVIDETMINHLMLFLGLNKKDIEILLDINNNSMSYGQQKAMRYYLKHISGKRLKQIRDTLKSMYSQEKLSNIALSDLFPQLSETELTVCRLVIKGLSMNEIADQLGKSKSNIGSVRTNIRRKLGLNTSQDLRDFLIYHP